VAKRGPRELLYCLVSRISQEGRLKGGQTWPEGAVILPGE